MTKQESISEISHELDSSEEVSGELQENTSEKTEEEAEEEMESSADEASALDSKRYSKMTEEDSKDVVDEFLGEVFSKVPFLKGEKQKEATDKLTEGLEEHVETVGFDSSAQVATTELGELEKTVVGRLGISKAAVQTPMGNGATNREQSLGLETRLGNLIFSRNVVKGRKGKSGVSVTVPIFREVEEEEDAEADADTDAEVQETESAEEEEKQNLLTDGLYVGVDQTFKPRADNVTGWRLGADAWAVGVAFEGKQMQALSLGVTAPLAERAEEDEDPEEGDKHDIQASLAFSAENLGESSILDRSGANIAATLTVDYFTVTTSTDFMLRGGNEKTKPKTSMVLTMAIPGGSTVQVACENIRKPGILDVLVAHQFDIFGKLAVTPSWAKTSGPGAEQGQFGLSVGTKG